MIEEFIYDRKKFILEKENGKTVSAKVQVLPGFPATKISIGLAEYFQELYQKLTPRN